jgi:hypothetical protein
MGNLREKQVAHLGKLMSRAEDFANMTSEEKYHDVLLNVIIGSQDPNLKTKCVECTCDAEFNHPRYLCRKHWTDWWLQDLPQDATSEEEKNEVIAEINRILDR